MKMNRLRSALLAAVAIPAIVPPAPAMAQAQGIAPAAPRIDELTVSARAAPREVFRDRLLPLESERTPGDAVPMYLRLEWEFNDDAKKLIDDKTNEYLNCPFSMLPKAEARKFVDQFGARLKLLDIAARRSTADWGYPIAEQKEDAINILLPDSQGLRRWVRLLAVKARVEIAEARYDDAVRTIQTGLSMARQQADGPFVINGLIGIAWANQMLARVEELIQQPDASNFYWALTSLPRPLSTLRRGIDTERALGEFVLPELAKADAPHHPAEWTAMVERLHGRWNRLATLVGEGPQKAPTIAPNLEKFRASVLPQARQFLKERGDAVEDMTEDEAIMRYIGGVHRELRDALFLPYYLPYPEAVPFYEKAEALRKSETGPIATMMTMLAPIIQTAHVSEVRVDRRIAALRTIEALRMQAAANGGKFPSTLADVKVVPVPNDPVTGRPFEFRFEDGAFALEGSPAAGGVPIMQYRIIPR